MGGLYGSTLIWGNYQMVLVTISDRKGSASGGLAASNFGRLRVLMGQEAGSYQDLQSCMCNTSNIPTKLENTTEPLSNRFESALKQTATAPGQLCQTRSASGMMEPCRRCVHLREQFANCKTRATALLPEAKTPQRSSASAARPSRTMRSAPAACKKTKVAQARPQNCAGLHSVLESPTCYSSHQSQH